MYPFDLSLSVTLMLLGDPWLSLLIALADRTRGRRNTMTRSLTQKQHFLEDTLWTHSYNLLIILNSASSFSKPFACIYHTTLNSECGLSSFVPFKLPMLIFWLVWIFMNDPTSMDVDSISVVDHQSLSMSQKLINVSHSG